MLKKLFKLFSGCGAADNGKSGSSSEGGIRDLENFVDYVVRNLVDFPDEVRVSSQDGEERTVISINCRKEDIGKIVGKRGKTIMAIRSLVSGAAGRLQKKIAVEVVD